jgi:hypothetical protein
VGVQGELHKVEEAEEQVVIEQLFQVLDVMLDLFQYQRQLIQLQWEVVVQEEEQLAHLEHLQELMGRLLYFQQ